MNRWNEEIVTQMKPQKSEILGNEKENVGKIVSNSKVWLTKCKESSIPYYSLFHAGRILRWF
jgi:hypothetical protein